MSQDFDFDSFEDYAQTPEPKKAPLKKLRWPIAFVGIYRS